MFSFISSYFKMRKIRDNEAFPNHVIELNLDEPFAVEILQLLAVDTRIKHLVITSEKSLSGLETLALHPALLALKNVLKIDQQLQTLKIANCSFDRISAGLFQEGLAANTTLKVIELENCNLDGLSGYLFSESIASLKQLKRIAIRSCYFLNRTSLIDALAQHANLTALDLNNTKLYHLPIDESNQLIQAITANPNLKVLNLENINFDDKEFSRKLVQALQGKTLKKLYFKHDDVALSDMLQANQLLQNQQQLEDVSIGSADTTAKINDKAFDNCFDTLKKHKAIKKATIAYRGLDYLASKLAELVLENDTLQEITLESSSMFFRKKISLDLQAFSVALESNLTLRNITCTYDHKDPAKFSHSIFEKTSDKVVANKVQNLLARNQLLFSIKQNPNQLTKLLEDASSGLFDELFFLNLLRTLPINYLTQYDSVLVKFMLKPASLWERFKWKVGISDGNTARVATVLETLVTSAESGNETDFKLLQQLHETPAFLNILGVDQWAQVLQTIAEKQPQFAPSIHYALGHLALTQTQDTNKAKEHFQAANGYDNANVLFLYTTTKQGNPSLGQIDQIHQAADTLDKLQTKEKEVKVMENSHAKTRDAYFTKYEAFLEKYKDAFSTEAPKALVDQFLIEHDEILAEGKDYDVSREFLDHKYSERKQLKNQVNQSLTQLTAPMPK